MSHAIRIAGTDLHFACADGQTLLDAALQAGIEMPYSCRKGVCGNCAGGVASGRVRCPPSDVAPPGQHLYCQCVPQSDVELVPVAWHRVESGARRRFRARVYRNTRAAADISVLQLRLPTGQRAKFRAGQYLQLTLDDGSERSFSMANAPHESDTLTLHIRHVPGGRFSAMLPDLPAGHAVDVELPYGNFSLADDTANRSRPIVFVAGGTGFAPIQSILDDMLKRGIRRPATLLWGVREPAHLYALAAVEKWKKQLAGFRFVAAISDPLDILPDGAVAGFVHDALAANVSTLAGHELYVCGSPPMVAAVRDVAEHRLALAPADFHSDVFVTAPPAGFSG